VSGFPDERRPGQGIFNLRTAQELAQQVDLTVVVPQAMRPGRPRISVERGGGMAVVRISAPVVPRAPRLTLRLYRNFITAPLAPYLGAAEVVHSVGAEFAGLLAGSLRGRFRYRHVTQLMNDLRNLRAPRFEVYPYLGTLRRNLHGILCNSRTLEETARRYFPEVDFVRTAYRGTDLALFAPEEAGGGLHAGPVRFLYLGGLPPYPDRTFGANTKGGITLMEAWSRGEDALRATGTTLLFGGPESSSERAREWAARLKYPDGVRLVGVVPPAQVPQLLSEADMVVIPSLEEGCPNIAFEALASGKAVLASDIGPLAEVVVHGECGLNLPAGNAIALKEALVEYSKPARRDELAAMGIAARARAERLFDHRNYARMVVGFYEELIAAGREADG